MSAKATSETMRSYLKALLSRGDFAEYFTDDVTWTIIGTDQTMQGQEPVRNFLTWMHTQALDAHPKVKTLVVGDGQAALAADLVGTHTGSSSACRPPASRSRCPTAWSTTCGTARSPPFGPTSPWTCSPSSWGERAAPAPRSGGRWSMTGVAGL
jgi:hypothetical protein